MSDPNAVLSFWFEEIEPSQWWTKDLDFDRMVEQRFQSLLERAVCCELSDWRTSAEGRLAEVIVLDQFSRNIYRDQPASFAADSLALALAQEAVSGGFDAQLTPTQRSFLYMPYMHSESMQIHEAAVTLFEKNGVQNNLDFEIAHKKIIEQFGRYPHRNEILGRTSTQAEIEFLTQPGSSF